MRRSAEDTLIHDKRWRPSSMIVWGSHSKRLGTVVHLPGAIGAYGCSTGATAACDRRERAPVRCAWTFSFGGPAGGRAHLCRRCFPDGKPNRKLRPPEGWLRYWWAQRGQARTVRGS
jgi:hypothetical protein